MLNRSADYTTDVPGYDHNMKNNVGFGGRSTEYNNLDFTKCKADTNYFNLPVTVNSADFLSMDQSLLTAPRQPDGSLPNNNFMRLVAGSDLINKGANIGFAYNGTAPDLGCYESGYELLPVDLLTFNSTVYNSTNVLLNWTVANQIQNTGWNIERTTSLNNNNDWIKIGFIASDNLQQTAYNFKDENLLKGNYQYRLKQIDKDGSIKYSKIVVATIDPNNKTTLSIYPNPIIEVAVIKYTIPTTSNVQLNLYNSEGRLISKLLDKMQGAGLNTFILTKKTFFVRGNYLLKLFNNNNVETVMFMKN